MSSIVGKTLFMAEVMAAMMGAPMTSPGSRVPTKEEMERERQVAEARHRKNLLSKGVQEFNIDGKIILARNYENALRKAQKFSTPSLERR